MPFLRREACLQANILLAIIRKRLQVIQSSYLSEKLKPVKPAAPINDM